MSDDGKIEDEPVDDEEGTSPPLFDPDVLPNPDSPLGDEAGPPQRTDDVFVEFAMSWQGKLPPPEALRAYEDIVEGSARRIVDDGLHASRLAEKSIALDTEVVGRYFDNQDRQQTLAEEESRSDREFRDRAFARIWPLPFCFLFLIVVVIFAPMGDWAKVIVIALLLAVCAIPTTIYAIKGRVTQTEADLIGRVVPEVTKNLRAYIHEERQRDLESETPEDHRLPPGQP